MRIDEWHAICRLDRSSAKEQLLQGPKCPIATTLAWRKRTEAVSALHQLVLLLFLLAILITARHTEPSSRLETIDDEIDRLAEASERFRDRDRTVDEAALIVEMSGRRRCKMGRERDDLTRERRGEAEMIPLVVIGRRCAAC